ncbi:MAG: hypothetical protein F4X25_09130, partial [Chloroflexi bacterium]|nr:hypothetical protein [Chloroflexota bacterium]
MTRSPHRVRRPGFFARWIALAGLVLALMLAGCTDSDEGDSVEPATATPAAAVAPPATPEPTPTATPEPTPT